MIIDVRQFIEQERPCWKELEQTLDMIEARSGVAMDVAQVRRFHYLYERVSADLSKLTTFATDRDTRTYLETLVSRAYSEIHETRRHHARFKPFKWFFNTFPQTVRRRVRALELSVTITMVGFLFGALVLMLDPEAKSILMPFGHLTISPEDRVEMEESAGWDMYGGRKTGMAAWYIQHNTRVAILAAALGASWGIGTLLLLFTNGVMLGGVVADFFAAGQGKFVTGWLLPHGSVEIPAILLAGQAGFVIAGAMLGRGSGGSMRARLMAVGSDFVTIIGGAAVLLVWAAFTEAFLSQYHEPVVPYWVKIALGVVNLALLTFFLMRCGRGEKRESANLEP